MSNKLLKIYNFLFRHQVFLTPNSKPWPPTRNCPWWWRTWGTTMRWSLSRLFSRGWPKSRQCSISSQASQFSWLIGLGVLSEPRHRSNDGGHSSVCSEKSMQGEPHSDPWDTSFSGKIIHDKWSITCSSNQYVCTHVKRIKDYPTRNLPEQGDSFSAERR